MVSTFTRARNLMPERWVQVTFSTDNCFKNVCLKSLMSSSYIPVHVHIAKSLFTVTSVKPSLGRINP